MLSKNKILIIFSSIITTIVILSLAFYLWFLPYIIKQDALLNNIQEFAKKELKLDIQIKNPYLKTYLKPKIYFSIQNLTIKNNSKTLIDLKDFEIYFSFEKLFKKRIKLKEINAKKLAININEILKIIPKTQNKTTKNDWFIDIFATKANLNYLKLIYLQNKTTLDIQAEDIVISNKNNFKTLSFSSEIEIKKENKKYLNIKILSKDEIKINENKILINDFDLLINNSKLKINSKIDEKNIIANLKSPNFQLSDVFSAINCDLIIPNGEQMLSVLSNPSGMVEFDIDFKNNNLDGVIFLNNTKANIKDLTQLPINIQKGKIIIQKDKIDFVDLSGFWGKNKNNNLEIFGNIKDYYKTFESEIIIKTVINNEFFKDYLAKLINNTELYISKPQNSAIIYKSKNNIMDITWLSKISKGVNFGIENEDSKLINFDRALKGDFHIENNDFIIKSINYYIAPNINRGVKIQPVISILGKLDLTGKIDNIGFSFDREIPCEFLNIFTKEKTFKKGTIKGNLFVKFKNDIPFLNSNLEINKTIIPSQRIFIKHAQLLSDDNIISANVDGFFKKVKFNFSGKIKNELKPPFIIKNLTLDLDKVDVEKFITSLANQETQTSETISDKDDETALQDDDYMFDTSLIVIEDCDFSLKEGKYKDVDFSNIKAQLTLDKNGILNIQSNKFNIAQGISTLRVKSDLKKLTHYVRLGIKDVNSNTLSKAILNLDNEISGLATGLIELNTDKSMKLNGEMKFIIKDGIICKIGLVEYLLKMVSLFRNPIAVINPTTLADIVSIPEGKFNNIYGEISIKDNVVNKIDIKSSADTLAALIRGRFDMERHDASIRVYTKTSDKKTALTFLKNISLGNFANKVLMNSKNDANYYASELNDIPDIAVGNEKAQIYLTQVEGDIERNNFISSLKRIK